MGKDNSLTWLYGSLHGYSPNVICIQESRLTTEMAKLFKMQGFETFHTPAASSEPSTGEKRGLITLVSKDLLVDRNHPKNFLNMGSETETLSVRVYTKKGWCVINNVYVHQKAKPSNLVFSPSAGKTVTVGDFNARHEEWEPVKENPQSDPMGNKLHALIQSNPNTVMVNSPRVPTTLSNTTLTLSLVSPDISLASDWDVLLDCSCQPHFATLTSVQLGPAENLPNFKPRYMEEKADWELFHSLTSQSDKPIESELNLKLSSLIDEIEGAKLKSIPLTKAHDKVKPWECWWFNEDCKVAKKKLHKAVKENLNKLPGSRVNLRRVRAETLNVYQQAKHKKWNEICQSLNLGSSLSIHWRRLRWIYNGGTMPSKSLVATAKAMANESMALFSNRTNPINLNLATRMVTSALAQARKDSVQDAIASPSPISDVPYSMEELLEVLHPFKKSSPGEDGITYQVLANLGKALLEKILDLINYSHVNHELPTKWKTIPHVPVPKSTPGEYRPIALLSCIDKIMESMQLARLKYLTGPLHHNLMGGVAGKGTEDAIATVVGMASDARNKRSGRRTLNLLHCYAVFIDYEKAFELADPNCILHLLAVDKGIKGHLLGWLKDFLSDRKGYTKVQGEESDIMPLYQGTPQGSVLSPFLYNILMDKVLTVMEATLGKETSIKITIMAYADDLVLISNHADAAYILTHALGKLESVSTILGLQINASKTKAMAWTRSHFFPTFTFSLYSNQIEWVRSFKYLGVVLDDNLSFSLHAKHICARAAKRVSVLKHLAGSPYGATQQTLLHYYKSCIRPILEYGSVALAIACPSAIKRIESMQNTALRIALRLPYHARTTFVLVEAGCSSMDDRLKTLAMSSWAKIKSAPDTHPFHQNKKDMHTEVYLLGRKPTRGRELPLEMSLLKTAEQAAIPDLQRVHVPPMNPTIPKQPPFVYDIKVLSKAKGSLTSEEADTLKQSVLSYISETFHAYDQFYVDGSVEPESGKAAAAYILHRKDNKISDAFRVSDHVSSTQAELAAIHQSLICIESNPSAQTQYVIHCDSQPAIQGLQRTKIDPLDKQVKVIIDLAEKLVTSKGIQVTLHWIPSHIGIPGNEEVDTLAKLGLKRTHVDISLPTTLGQVKAVIRRHVSLQTKSFFNTKARESSKVGSHALSYSSYLMLNPTLQPQKSPNLPPAVHRVLNRLRLDTESWCYRHSHGYSCAYCEQGFSPHHYLIECPVTSSPLYVQQLTLEEHNLCLKKQALVILKRLEKKPFGFTWISVMEKYPIRVTCGFPEHGEIPHTIINIPSGL